MLGVDKEKDEVSNQIQEDHCESLYKNYHILLKYVKAQWEFCDDEMALNVLKEIGEIT